MAICWKRSCTASRLHDQALRCDVSQHLEIRHET